MRWNWKIVVINNENMLTTTLADGTINVRPCKGATLSQWIAECEALNSNIVNTAAMEIERDMPHPIVDEREVLTDPERLDR